MSTTYDVDGGNAVLEVGRMLSGIEPDGLRRAGDEARLGQATTLFARAVRHVVHGAATKRGDLVPIVQPGGDSAAPVATVKVGDTFRVIAHAGLPAGSVGEVVELYPLDCVGIIGPGWRLTTSAQVLLGPGWKTVRAVEAPPALGEVGDRFERVGSGYYKGSIFEVKSVSDDGHRALESCPPGASWNQRIDDLANAHTWRPLPSSADRAAANPDLLAAVLGPDPDDLHGPAGDAVVALTLPGAIAMQQDLLEQIRRLIPTSQAYAASLDSYDPYQDVSDIVAALAQSIGYDRKGGL